MPMLQHIGIMEKNNSILGLCWDNGKENGTTIVYWLGFMQEFVHLRPDGPEGCRGELVCSCRKQSARQPRTRQTFSGLLSRNINNEFRNSYQVY